MLSDDLIERLSHLAAFSRNPREVGARLPRLIETPANRWRRDWIAALFPGISESDKAALMSSIDTRRSERPRGFVPDRLEALRRRLPAFSFTRFALPRA